jgi:hypothetical protein
VPLGNINKSVQSANEEVLAGGAYKTWKSDGALVKLMARCRPINFFKGRGPASVVCLYGGWKPAQRKESRFWAYLTQWLLRCKESVR